MVGQQGAVVLTLLHLNVKRQHTTLTHTLARHTHTHTTTSSRSRRLTASTTVRPTVAHGSSCRCCRGAGLALGLRCLGGRHLGPRLSCLGGPQVWEDGEGRRGVAVAVAVLLALSQTLGDRQVELFADFSFVCEPVLRQVLGAAAVLAQQKPCEVFVNAEEFSGVADHLLLARLQLGRRQHHIRYRTLVHSLVCLWFVEGPFVVIVVVVLILELLVLGVLKLIVLCDVRIITINRIPLFLLVLLEVGLPQLGRRLHLHLDVTTDGMAIPYPSLLAKQATTVTRCRLALDLRLWLDTPTSPCCSCCLVLPLSFASASRGGGRGSALPCRRADKIGQW
mmetsp:Transcript_6560/g.15874  ORF Transcript_6560/g.15874 Transcript_6560/m.15874 type:complete len:336 (-) Transcript_6560:1651-2658(-)